MKRHVITSSHWGAGLAEVDDGRLVSVGPHPNDPSHDLRTSSLSQGPASHSALVDIEKFEGELPAIKAFEPPELLPS